MQDEIAEVVVEVAGVPLIEVVKVQQEKQVHDVEVEACQVTFHPKEILSNFSIPLEQASSP